MKKIAFVLSFFVASCSAQPQPNPKTAGELVDFILQVLCGSATNPGEACATKLQQIEPLIEQRRALMTAPKPRDAGAE